MMREKSDSFVLGKRDSNVAICTFWTLAKTVSEKIPKDSFFICANLYSTEGINTIFRSILAHPKIRCLVLFGADLTHTGDIIQSFFEKGVDENGAIAGTPIKPHSEIPKEDLELLRRNVELIDFRGKNANDLKDRIMKLNPMKAFANAKTYPEPKGNEFQTVHSEKIGFVFHAPTVSEGWLKILDTIIKFGEEKPTEYGNRMKEILDFMMVIDGREETIPNFLPCNAKAVEEYTPKLLTAEKPENIVYTYGSRLRQPLDQINGVIEYLRKTPETRRAIAVTWRPEEDLLHNKSPPCLNVITWNVTNGFLHQTNFFRSHDMFDGWPLNTYGLQELQKKIASETNLKIGKLVTVSVSAHIYDSKWLEAKKILEKNYPKSAYRFKQDPRGNFVIKIEKAESGKKIVLLQHFTHDGQKTQYAFHSSKETEKLILEDLFNQLAHENLISQTDHAFYLGAEVYKALTAIKTGKKYEQDKPLE